MGRRDAPIDQRASDSHGGRLTLPPQDRGTSATARTAPRRFLRSRDMHPTTPTDGGPPTSSDTSRRPMSLPHRKQAKTLAAVPSTAARLRRAKVAVLCRTTTTAANAEPVNCHFATHYAHHPEISSQSALTRSSSASTPALAQSPTPLVLQAFAAGRSQHPPRTRSMGADAALLIAARSGHGAGVTAPGVEHRRAEQRRDCCNGRRLSGKVVSSGAFKTIV